MSDEVMLRDVQETDLEVFFEQEQDPEASQRSRFPPRERERFMTRWRTRVLGDPTVRAQTITVNGQTAGSVVAWWKEQERYVGYWLGRQFWGRGVGTQALTQFLQQEATRPLYADPYVGNTASIRLLERCGFRRLRTDRDGDTEFVVLELPA